MKKWIISGIIGVATGLYIQIGILHGYRQLFVSLSFPAMITVGQLFAHLFPVFGRAIDIHMIPFVYSVSIPIFYALVGAVVGYLIDKLYVHQKEVKIWTIFPF